MDNIYAIEKANLIPDTANANAGTEKGRRLLRKSLKDLGAGRSILADKNGNIIAGNKTLEGAAEINLPVRIIHTDGKELVVVQRDDLDLYSDTDKRGRQLAYADNKVAELDLSWKPEQIEADFEPLDLGEWGFVDQSPETADAEPQIDRAAELNEKWQVKTGDLWKIGDHRLLCGDSTKREDVERVMGGELCDLVVTDPPYNVAIVGGTHDPRDQKNFGKGPKIENDSMSDSDFDIFLSSVFDATNEAMKRGCVYYVCAPAGRTETQFRNAIDKVWALRECIVWAKQQAVFGRQDYHWKHESILYGWKDGAAHYFCDDRTQSTVWEIDRPMRSEKEHPTQKPPELFQKMISNSSRNNDIVYEPFAGSGTTLVACENLSRKCRAIEISPNYCAVILERMATAFPELTIERIDTGN